ncbi:gamma-glutamylcyclotransferase family protein [Roseovarius phycicola]|uniref:Gamma-glutamylcyclotransferase family protein n=1 Tax=Roseovarius phycicola TaxID=3080976 RepID=A0ABZ2HEL1_9RHOB
MSGGYFFGYGSLVNTATHSFAEAHPAQLKGWRRMWRKTKMRQAAYLTVVPDSEAEIDGLIAEVPHGDWEALDERERAYARVDAAHQVSHPLPAMPAIVVYAIEDGRHGTPDRQSPVLLSYIDVVVQGYLHNFGEAGVQRFFDTTGGWDAPVVDDRDAPVYPRHQSLSADEYMLVDDMLARVGAIRDPMKSLSPWHE